jgi:hypothetical protein
MNKQFSIRQTTFKMAANMFGTTFKMVANMFGITYNEMAVCLSEQFAWRLGTVL